MLDKSSEKILDKISINKLFPLLILSTSFLFLLNSTYAFANSTTAQYQQCATCHGDKGQGNSALKSPVLAGQYAWYLNRQLLNFSKGIRGVHKDDAQGQQMAAMAKTINVEKEGPTLSEYIASMPPPKNENKAAKNLSVQIKGNFKNGSRYYQGKCGACHGGQAQGNKAFNAPKLAGQDSDYLLRQMQNFTKGIRGTDTDDKFGRQMAMMAKMTSGKELNDILFYISEQ